MRTLGWVIGAALIAFASDAIAGSPAFFVTKGPGAVGGDVASVVVVSDGSRHVVTIERDYVGTAQDFALVIPVPARVRASDVKVLPRGVTDKLDRFTAPVLVDAWETDPCPPENTESADRGYRGMKGEEGSIAGPLADAYRPLDVVGRFDPREYRITLVTGSDASTIDGWLRDRGYRVPANAHATLAPYASRGDSFIVAVIDPAKARLENGRAYLSPIRFAYDGDAAPLALALGAIDGGVRDLVLHVAARARNDVDGAPSTTPPVDVAVHPTLARRFDAFYGAVFEAAVARQPGAFVTEFAARTGDCSDCGSWKLTQDDWALLGFDVLTTLPSYEAVVTRLHARWAAADPGVDARFRAAPPIAGGNEPIAGASASRRTSTSSADYDHFHARYIAYHPSLGQSTCPDPEHDAWTQAMDARPTRVVVGRGFARTSGEPVDVGASVESDVPVLGARAHTTFGFDRWRSMRYGLAWGGGFGIAFAVVLVLVRRRRAR